MPESLIVDVECRQVWGVTATGFLLERLLHIISHSDKVENFEIVY